MREKAKPTTESKVGLLTVASLRDCGQYEGHGSRPGVGANSRFIETVDNNKLVALRLASGLTVAPLL